jgi:hypothetical protein
MRDPQRFTTLWASMTCYRDTFTFTFTHSHERDEARHYKIEIFKQYLICHKKLKNSVAFSPQANLPTERPPLVGEVFNLSYVIQIWRMPCTGMWRRVDLLWTDVSEECIASIFRVEKSASKEPAWACGCRQSAVASNSVLLLSLRDKNSVLNYVAYTRLLNCAEIYECI